MRGVLRAAARAAARRGLAQLAGCAIATLLVAVVPPAFAHEYQLDTVVSVFVDVERGGDAHLVVRAPLYLFRAVRFPSARSELELDQAGPALERAVAALKQDVRLLEDGRPLAATSGKARLSLPSDRAFESYETALAHVDEPIDPTTRITVDQGYVDAHLTYRTTAPGAPLALQTNVAAELGPALRVTVRYRPADGAERAYVVKGGIGTLDLNPSAFVAARGFVVMGIAHILGGADHLLFLLALIIPLRGLRQLVAVITMFTVAHSLTLAGSMLGITPRGAWFAPFVETLIAASIVYTALENIVGVDLRRRVLLTMLFGIVHGFGFSYGLQEQLQFAGAHLWVSLLAFNLGIEIGQLFVLALALPALALVSRYLLPGRAGTIVLAALLAHAGWHWLEERWDALARVRWPSFELASLPLLLFWFAGLSVAVGAAVLVAGRLRLQGPPAQQPGD